MTNQGSAATIVSNYISFRSLYNSAIPLYNPVSGVQYSGKNIDKLNEEVKEQGYTDPRWFTFIQGKSLGYKLKKGSKSVRLFKFGEKKENSETAELFKNMGIDAKPDTYTAPFYVFNAENFENVPPFKYEYTPEEIHEIFKKIMANTQIQIAFDSQNENYYDAELEVLHFVPPEHMENKNAWYTDVLYNIIFAEILRRNIFINSIEEGKLSAYITTVSIQARFKLPIDDWHVNKLVALKNDCTRIGCKTPKISDIEYIKSNIPELFQGIELKPLPLLTPSDDKTPLETVIKEVTEMQGVELKQSGTWYWASGNTKAFKEKLKELSFRFSRKRCAWYYVSAM